MRNSQETNHIMQVAQWLEAVHVPKTKATEYILLD